MNMAGHLRLFRNERLSGFLVLIAILLGMAAANTPLKPYYDLVHHTPIHIRVGPLIIDRPLIDWVNEGLMVFFFLMVGLEIKRQFYEGHLSTIKCAILPPIAAIGGMVVPAAIYLGLTWPDPALLKGWAIPTATDIVLALGVLSLLGSKVPDGVKVFLAALAIFDDIGAVMIIGVFYGDAIASGPLLVTLVAAGGLVLLNRFRVLRPAAFFAAGIVLWAAMLKAGLEAALAGVIIALAVPMRSAGCRCSSPVRETERRLHPWCILLIVPVFAFFNSGVAVDSTNTTSLLAPSSLGIVAGLFLGKQLGVFGFSWMAVRLGLGAMPARVSWAHLYGIALLAGVGFTMSLFVATLAFSSPALLSAAKLAILLSSALSATAGLLWLNMTLGSEDRFATNSVQSDYRGRGYSQQ